MQLRPIGRVHAPVTQRKQMAAWGVPASVEIFPEFEPALLHIGKHSHLWILAWLDQGRDERHVLQVTPRGATSLHGVFAVRSPARPNPIGMTAARVTARQGVRIDLDRLDFLDGTPVVDIKPYFVTRDMLFSANGRQVGSPLSRAALRESLAIQASQFLGGMCPEGELAVRIIEEYRAEVHALNDPPSWHVTVPINRPKLIDAIMGMTRATPGRGNLMFHDRDEVWIAPDFRVALEGAFFRRLS